MDVFELRDRVVGDYAEYVRSFFDIRDARIRKLVDDELASGRLWPEPLLQLNPVFAHGGFADDRWSADLQLVMISSSFDARARRPGASRPRGLVRRSQRPRFRRCASDEPDSQFPNVVGETRASE